MSAFKPLSARAWTLAAGIALLAGGVALLVYYVHFFSVGAHVHLYPVRSAALVLAAGSALLLGGLILARVRDALLIAAVLLDAGALAALLLPLAVARVHLSLLGPLGLLAVTLAAVAFSGAGRFAGVPVLTALPHLFLAGALGLYALLQGVGGRLGGVAWVGLLGAGALAAVCQVAYSHAPTETERPWARLAQLPRWARGLIVYGVVLAGFAAAAGARLSRPSRNNHFVYLADCYLRGRLSLDRRQLARKNRLGQKNDWAKVLTVQLRREVKSGGRLLRKGTRLRGDWITTRRGRSDIFRTTRGRRIQLSRSDYRGDKSQWYVSFPPLPALLMAPGVAIWGYGFNDVWFSVLFGALAPLLLWLLLGRLRREGLSDRQPGDDYWLTLLFAFGSVTWFVAAQGEVWFTAHMVGLVFLLAYLHASVGARFPVLAGLALGCAVASRVPLLFAFPIFFAELWRIKSHHRDRVAWRRLLAPTIRFGLPLVAVGLALAAHNLARFDSPFEFGHRYLDIYWKWRIQEFGLFDVHYLTRNLTSAFVLLPHLQPEPPYLLVSRHGLSLLLVSPVLLLLLWPRLRGAWHWPLWLSVAPMATLVLLYQNTGFVQFSYRFAVDFLPLLVLLIALGGRRLSTPIKVLILVGVLWNLLGALTFGLAPEFYGHTNWMWTPLDPGCRC